MNDSFLIITTDKQTLDIQIQLFLYNFKTVKYYISSKIE